MLLTGFGWAKAVPVNPRYFKNPRQGMALTALAGPAANLLFGFVLLLLYRVFGGVVVGTPLYLTSAPFQIFTYAVLVNCLVNDADQPLPCGIQSHTGSAAGWFQNRGAAAAGTVVF